MDIDGEFPAHTYTYVDKHSGDLILHVDSWCDHTTEYNFSQDTIIEHWGVCAYHSDRTPWQQVHRRARQILMNNVCPD